MKNIIAVFISALLLLGCSQNHSTKVNSDNASDSIISTGNGVSETVELSGLYANHHFTTCDDSRSIVVNGDVKKLDSIYSILLPDAYSGQSIFVKIKGSVSTTEGNQSLSVSEILSAEQKNAFNTCISYDYWCMGNEPFWQIQISEKENLIDFYDPMLPKFYHFNFSKAEINGSKTIYTVEDKGSNNKLKITITKEKCSDGMSERNYNFKSEAVLNGTTYNGCAVVFGETLKSN